MPARRQISRPWHAAGKAELRLWLRLLSTTNIISGQIRRRLRAKFDVTLPAFDLMAQLDREPDGLRLGELSKRMMVTNGNLTGLVERLVQEGLVKRETDPQDRRAFIVRLSRAGKTKFAVYARGRGGGCCRCSTMSSPGSCRR